MDRRYSEMLQDKEDEIASYQRQIESLNEKVSSLEIGSGKKKSKAQEVLDLMNDAQGTVDPGKGLVGEKLDWKKEYDSLRTKGKLGKYNQVLRDVTMGRKIDDLLDAHIQRYVVFGLMEQEPNNYGFYNLTEKGKYFAQLMELE